MKKLSRKALTIIVAVILTLYMVLLGVGIWFAYDLTVCEPYGKLETMSVGDGQNLKVGIFSDSQLPADGNMNSRHIKALRATLQAMKDAKIEVLIMAGDFTDLGTKKAWQSFKTTYDEVFGDNKPIASFSMGNHDYWLDWFSKSGEIGSPQKMKRRFTEYTGEAPFSHKVVNDYHFIGWSMNNGSYDKSYSDTKWMKEQLDIAVTDDPTKPIFVTTHMNPQDTIYGSDDWGNKDITELLNSYPQVINFSGHSHYALEDERSINQKEFTAINTQTIDYIELEDGKYNGTVPKDAYGNDASHNPIGMIMDVTADKVNIQRISIDENSGTVKNVRNPWIISAPFGDKSSFKYVNEGENGRINRNTAPEITPNDMSIETTKDINKADIKVLKFDAARDLDGFVHSYKLVFKNADNDVLSFNKTSYDGTEFVDKDTKKTVLIRELLYFTDFSMGIDKMSKTVTLRLPQNMPEDTAIIVITAIDSWGKESNAIEYKLSV